MTNTTLASSATLTDKKLPFHIGRVFKNTFRQLARNFWLVLLEVIIITIVLTVLLNSIILIYNSHIPYRYYIFIKHFCEKFSTVLPNAIIVIATIHNLNGRPLKIGEAIRIGASRFFPLLATSLMVSIAVLTGMVLLIVPGMFLITMWFVAGTACVGERLGPIESLKRSQVLTKG